MFEFMHNYRLPILVVIFVSMMGFGAYGAIQALFDGPPNELEGTFAESGEGAKSLMTALASSEDFHWG